MKVKVIKGSVVLVRDDGTPFTAKEACEATMPKEPKKPYSPEENPYLRYTPDGRSYLEAY